ncbi:MAG: hypothetical protein ACJ77E_11085, partial [Gaiellaceae bacterium]
MRLRLCFLGVLTFLAAGCGASGTATTTVRTTTASTTATTTTTAPAAIALTVFRVDNGVLRPTVTRVPRTTAVAGAALAALRIHAPVSIADGTATVAFDGATRDEQAEIVYTLTQFPTVARVDV